MMLSEGAYKVSRGAEDAPRRLGTGRSNMPFTEDGWVEEYEHAECHSCGATLINTPNCPTCEGEEGWG